MVLSYLIPGAEGSVEEGKRLVNWVWYQNTTEEELKEVMTGCDGVRH